MLCNVHVTASAKNAISQILNEYYLWSDASKNSSQFSIELVRLLPSMPSHAQSIPRHAISCNTARAAAQQLGKEGDEGH